MANLTTLSAILKALNKIGKDYAVFGVNRTKALASTLPLLASMQKLSSGGSDKTMAQSDGYRHFGKAFGDGVGERPFNILWSLAANKNKDTGSAFVNWLETNFVQLGIGRLQFLLPLKSILTHEKCSINWDTAPFLKMILANRLGNLQQGSKISRDKNGKKLEARLAAIGLTSGAVKFFVELRKARQTTGKGTTRKAKTIKSLVKSTLNRQKRLTGELMALLEEAQLLEAAKGDDVKFIPSDFVKAVKEISARLGSLNVEKMKFVGK
jgi:hypothetical protein